MIQKFCQRYTRGLPPTIEIEKMTECNFHQMPYVVRQVTSAACAMHRLTLLGAWLNDAAGLTHLMSPLMYAWVVELNAALILMVAQSASRAMLSGSANVVVHQRQPHHCATAIAQGCITND